MGAGREVSAQDLVTGRQPPCGKGPWLCGRKHLGHPPDKAEVGECRRARDSWEEASQSLGLLTDQGQKDHGVV